MMLALPAVLVRCTTCGAWQPLQILASTRRTTAGVTCTCLTVHPVSRLLLRRMADTHRGPLTVLLTPTPTRPHRSPVATEPEEHP